MALATRVRELFRLDRGSLRVLERRYVAPRIAAREDIHDRRAKLAAIIAGEIIPHLVRLHRDVPLSEIIPDVHPTEADIHELAHIVLGPEGDAAAAYVMALRHRGVSAETLFVELLAPTAKLLGEMWHRDECDFIDVTLGVARLQKLLAVGNATHRAAMPTDRRSILVATAPGEQHHFGVAMLEQLLDANRWTIVSDHHASFDSLCTAVDEHWLAVVALSLGTDSLADDLKHAIGLIRSHSRNKAVRVMVGGSSISRRPELADWCGADASALNAPSAVLLAQKLFDEGAVAHWGEARLSA
ncbi:cobalamin B12-binding domain-containing protein [Sphingomonas sp. GlSt437]|uniref:cobalamin B12-binding domain-containing protein n=1 Tax=Sphingomonas sp. GlSt437 TaxID=3389970 RepID=UPI003A89387E